MDPLLVKWKEDLYREDHQGWVQSYIFSPMDNQVYAIIHDNATDRIVGRRIDELKVVR